MFTALTLSLALAAPVPAPAAPVATGVAPRVMELKADANGKVMIAVTRTEKVQVGVGNAIAPAGGAGGGVAPAVIAREMKIVKMVELGDVKDLIFTTADGMKVEKDDAMKRLASGSIVVVTSDGKPVSPAFLKVFKDDTLVLVAPELIAPAGASGGTVGGPIKGFPGGGIRPLPAPLPPVQIQPGVIQVIPVQGGIQIEVAPEVIPVDKTPKPAPEK